MSLGSTGSARPGWASLVSEDQGVVAHLALQGHTGLLLTCPVGASPDSGRGALSGKTPKVTSLRLTLPPHILAPTRALGRGPHHVHWSCLTRVKA